MDKISELEYTLLGVMHSVDKWLDGEELNHDEVTRAATMREKTLQIVEKLIAEKERLQCLLLQFTAIISQWGAKYDIDTSAIPMAAIMQKETAKAKQELFAEAHKELIKQLEQLLETYTANGISPEEFYQAYKNLLDASTLNYFTNDRGTN